jgi:transcriptional regulator with XRE-family HTH domain
MGKTQTRLSREVGISQASLCNIEKGRKDPRAGTLARIAEALDCGLDTFFVCD